VSRGNPRDDVLEQDARTALRFEDSGGHLTAQPGDVFSNFEPQGLQVGFRGHGCHHLSRESGHIGFRRHAKCGQVGLELVLGDHLTTDGRKLIPHLAPELHNLQLDRAHADLEARSPRGQISQ
jgi:hypothetical protein